MAALRSRRGAARERQAGQYDEGATEQKDADSTEQKGSVAKLLLLSKVLEAVLFGVAIAHVLTAPYTKVEESFSLQAIHDILTFGTKPSAIEKYDHVVFSGAVPRSFIGPLLLSAISYPILVLGRLLGVVRNSANAGLGVRLILACLYAASICRFGRLVVQGSKAEETAYSEHKEKTRGKDRELHTNVLLRLFFLAISTVQFQPLFWAGRTTPNGIVMPVVVYALGSIFSDTQGTQQHRHARVGIVLLIASAVISRLELVGVLAPVGLYLLFTGRAGRHWRLSGLAREGSSSPAQKFLRRTLLLVALSLAGAIVALASTLVVDTYFWRRSFALETAGQKTGLLWPELEAVLFNVVDGKSAEWGVSPRHAYITSHLPKLVSAAVLLAPVGALTGLGRQEGKITIDTQIAPMLFVCIAHVATMSLVAHKEARFIAYLVPLVNAMAARGALVLWDTGTRSEAYASQVIRRLALIGTLASMAALTVLSTMASAWNYPGGQALAALHRLRSHAARATVHIDVLPAMTGVSLYQSIHLDSRPGKLAQSVFPCVTCEQARSNTTPARWTYDKTDDLFVTSNDIFVEKERAQLRAQLVPTFDFIVSDSPTCHGLDGFEVIMSAEGKEKRLAEFPEFSGIRRRRPWPDVRAFIGAVKAPQSFTRRAKRAILLAMPIELTWKPSVWLCERVPDTF